MDKINEITLSIMQNRNTQIKIIFFIILILLLVIVIIWAVNKTNLRNSECASLQKSSLPRISSINPTDAQFNYNLRDYYIKSSYNSCCLGNYKDDFVDVCALSFAIKQGCRFLDFEIYSIDNQPVIAASTKNSFFFKETYNSVPFANAMNVIMSNAFTAGNTCPNPNDPLILHFRIKSNNTQMLDNMAQVIYNTLEPRLLDIEYANEFDGQNIGGVPLQKFMNKIIILVDNSNPIFAKTKLNQYINGTSNSVFIKKLSNFDVVNTPNMDDLIEFNKKNMSITFPDLNSNTNSPVLLHMNYGCQMIGMALQNDDKNLELYNKTFNDSGYAFILKPENLRFIPLTIDPPKQQKPELSFATRNFNTDYASWSV